MIVERRCPAWNGLAMFGEENSTTTVFPAPSVELPHVSPAANTFFKLSATIPCLLMKKFRYGPAAEADLMRALAVICI